MDQDAIIEYIAATFSGVDIERPGDGPGAGDTFFIYDPERNLEPKQRFPFATLVTKDYGDFDNTSNLNRADVFRLNIGIRRETFRALFGDQPAAAGAADSTYDFAALDRLLPHPVYATQFFVCVLNPSRETFQTLRPLLAEAFDLAASRHTRREGRRPG